MEKQSHEDYAKAIKARLGLVYQPVGISKMGTDDMAVVDPALRVHGIDDLRITDT